MIVNTTGGRNHRTDDHIENRLAKYTEVEKNEFIGRLVELLVTKSIITLAEAGNLFYEDWAP